MPIEILILLSLIVLNGAFAMSEIALLTARRARLQVLVDEGDRGAAAAVRLNGEPTQFLSTIQVGITSIGILSGIVGEAALAPPLSEWLVTQFGIKPAHATLGATGLVVVVVTYFAIVLGELVPKRLGQMAPERVARRVARPIAWLAMAARPFVHLLATSTDAILRLLGVRSTSAAAVTEEEIHALIKEGSESGVIDEQERAMVRNVFRLDDRQIASLMTTRSDIVHVDLGDPDEVNLEKIIESGHARLPVSRGGLDNVIGVITARSLLRQVMRGQRPDLAAMAEAVLYVPESLTGMELLENFRTTNSQMALVVDEYGEIQGLVTVQDLLEAITGEFRSLSVDDAWAVQRPDGSWLLDGLIPIPELKDRLEFATAPEEALGRYNTLSGMVMLLLGRVPRTGDTVSWQGWRFEIVDMDRHRIDKVLATRVTEAPDALEHADGRDAGSG